MHPRSRYCNARPEFTQLASKHAGFNAASHGGKRINFKSEQFQRELTRALLEVDFGLQVELPHDRLVPAVPQRLNYLHWVEDLVTGGDDAAGQIPRGSTVRGVDIGEKKCSLSFAMLRCCKNLLVCVCVCVYVSVCACARVCVCVGGGGVSEKKGKREEP